MRFLSNERRKDAQYVGPLTDHHSHYQVLILRARVGSYVQEERREEILFPVTCNSVLWMVDGKAASTSI